MLLPGPSRRLASVIKCSPFLTFCRLHCEGYIADLLLGVLTGSLKSYPPFWKAGDSFWGNDLYDALGYERKFKSEYLERQIYEWLLKSEPSIVKLIENKSDLSKLSTSSESSIVKFSENQSEHLSKLTLYHLKKRVTRRSSDLVFNIWRNNNTEATLIVFCLWLWITSVLASTEEGEGLREIDCIYAIPCPTGPR